MNSPFQIFGSKSSQDIDVIVFVDYIPEKEHIATELCKKYNSELSVFLNTDKVINSNLAILENGIIKNVYKGTEDEVNNSCIRTYDLHTQYHPNQIRSFIERDVDLKILRTCRVLLSFLSRTKYRDIVKNALYSDCHEKIKTLYMCDISDFTKDDILKRNVLFTDFLKIYAFQLGQTIGLIQGIELYTKEEIMDTYPELTPYILRDDSQNLIVLNQWKNHFLDLIKDMKLKSYIEYNFGEL